MPTTDASYTDSSPYVGQNCSTCVAMGDSGCDWVAVSCSPQGWCKFNITPVLIRASAEKAAELQFAKYDHEGEGSLGQESATTVYDDQTQDDDSGDDTRDFEDDSSDFGVMMSADISKGQPGVGSVHVDSVSWDGDVKPELPENMTILDGDQMPEPLDQFGNAADDSEDDSIPGTIRKDAEMRYTLGPWYVPYASDAHGEWTDPAELQQALWGYIRSGDRDIRLQHNVDIVAGEWVEAMQWPYDVSIPMVQAGTGRVSNVSFPAGTCFLGVIWKPWAWELVKQGKIGGYSMGGTGAGIEVDMPEPSAVPIFPIQGQ